MTKLSKKTKTMSFALAIMLGGTAASCEDLPYISQDVVAPNVYTNPNPTVEQWHQTALAAGWAEQDWYTVSCIMQGESGGWEWVYNGRGRDRSYGLMGINTKGSLWNFYRGTGLTNREQLKDPLINLQSAKVLSDYNATQKWAKFDRWKPWRSAARTRRACFK